MSTISEAEISGDDLVNSCVQCPDYEGAIYLCGEGFICERCFAEMAGIDESELFINDDPLQAFDIPQKHTARVKANLLHQKGSYAEDEA